MFDSTDPRSAAASRGAQGRPAAPRERAAAAGGRRSRRRATVATAALAGLALLAAGRIGLGAPTPTPQAGTESSAVTVGRPVVVRGEVVEASCFFRDGKRGEGHRACALLCLKNGGQLGVVEDSSGTYYSIATNSPGTDPNALVKEFVAQHVAVTGRLYERGGQKLLVLERVQRLGD